MDGVRQVGREQSLRRKRTQPIQPKETQESLKVGLHLIWKCLKAFRGKKMKKNQHLPVDAVFTFGLFFPQQRL